MAIHFQGDLHAYLKNEESLRPTKAIRFAIDIARFTCHSTLLANVINSLCKNKTNTYIKCLEPEELCRVTFKTTQLAYLLVLNSKN